MDQIAIVKRAWTIVWRYKVLWLFGILIALTSGGGGGGGGSGYRFNGNDFNRPQFQNMPWLRDVLRPERLVGIVALCCCLLFLVVIASAIVQFVSRAALIRSVDQIEETGAAPTWREALRLGWTHRTFRLWLLELIVGIIVGLGALVLLLLAAAPLLLLLTNTDGGRVVGIVLTVMLGLLVLLVLIVVAIILSVLQEFWSREVLLADRGIGDALSSGYALVRSRVRDIGGMWLVMLGIGIGFGLLMIPIVLAVIALSAGLGGGLGYVVHEATRSVPWAVAVGLPIFLIIMLIPLSLIGGLYKVFTSSAWTLAYRQVTRPTLPPAPEPEPIVPEPSPDPAPLVPEADPGPGALRARGGARLSSVRAGARSRAGAACTGSGRAGRRAGALVPPATTDRPSRTASPRRSYTPSAAERLAAALQSLYDRPQPPVPWRDGGNLPWDEPEFSERMLAEHLDQSHGAATRRLPEVRALVQIMTDWLALGEGSRLFDITCGPGLYAAEFARRGVAVTGIDFGPASVRYARELCAGLPVEIHQGDVRQMDFSGRGFDAAIYLYGQFTVLRPGRIAGRAAAHSRRPAARRQAPAGDPG